MGFTTRLKEALVGGAEARFVFVGNVEVERQWAAGAIGLPRLSYVASDVVVNRMDELTLTLAGPDDYVLLKAPPDPGYLAYLAGIGLDLPTVIAVGAQDPQRMVTEDALADSDAITRLAALASPHTYLLPHGVSVLEEQLAASTGLPLAAPPAALCRAVNSKVYSRRVTDELGLRQPVGWACNSLEELAAAVTGAMLLIADGRRVVFKDAFGVSGKGIAVVDDPRRLDRLHRMVGKEANRSGGQVAVVIEERVAKETDLNYQFTIGADGKVWFDFVKRALTANGVHKGHLMPAGLDDRQFELVRRAAHLLGDRLAADGYRGVVGVDAMLDPDGGVYPVTEINARNNMSTYQTTLTERLLGPGSVALARHYELKLDEPVAFARLHQQLGGLLLERAGDTGLVVNAFATVNAAAPIKAAAHSNADGNVNTGFGGRLYGVVVAGSAAELAEIDSKIEGAIGAQ